MKRLGLVLLAAVAVLLAAIAFNTVRFTSRQLPAEPYESLPVEAAAAAQRLAKALTFPTISRQVASTDSDAAFQALHDHLEASFPRVHETLEREKVNDFSLLYTWPGTNPEARPIVLLAHLDVVPIAPGSEGDWTHPPFDGVIEDGIVWGRGALDNKASVLGILEAVELLLAEDHEPNRTVYLAFGHDEEIGGREGAAKMAELIKARGPKPEFSLDEGLAVVQDMLPGVDKPVALIGLAEKGYVSLKLTARNPGGHSSTPGESTAIGILSRAVQRLEENQMPARFAGPIREMLEFAGPEMPLAERAVMANLWLFQGIVKQQLMKDAAPRAAMRTTTAPTIIQAGTKENVLPTEATAIVNFRILPGDTVDAVLAHAEKVIDDDRVEIAVNEGHNADEPSPVSQLDAPAFEMLHRSLRQVFPDAAVAPGMTLGGTDSKHYVGATENQYRVQPLIMTDADLTRIHGTNERIAIDNYLRSIQAFGVILRNATS